MTDEEVEAKFTALDDTLNILAPLITDCADRLDTLEALVEKLGPALDMLNQQQRERMAELWAELAVRDAELARLKGNITMN